MLDRCVCRAGVCRVANRRVFDMHKPNELPSNSTNGHNIPRLGERTGVAGRWFELAGGFVKITERFGSLALTTLITDYLLLDLQSLAVLLQQMHPEGLTANDPKERLETRIRPRRFLS
jgi:hypothetical protein